jgi:hypothetical protein
MARVKTFWIKTSALLNYANPFEETAWVDLSNHLTLKEVDQVLVKGQEKLWPPFCFNDWVGLSSLAIRRRHLQKVAWFVKHGFQAPISLDVGIPSMGYCPSWLIDDGNHRFTAAAYRRLTLKEDPILPCHIGGSLDHFKKMNLV